VQNTNDLPKLRRCFLQPEPEHDLAADSLAQAADALLRNDLPEAAGFLRKADHRCLQEHCRKVSKINPEIHHRTKNPVYTKFPPSPGPHMPGAGVIREVLARDGYRCRFCGCRVIVNEARKTFIKTLPAAAKFDDGRCHHSALAALRASIDHVVPFRRGGTNNPDNLVTACGPCQFGRGHWLLKECDLDDPRQYPPLIDSWDGLVSLRGFKLHK
jgi:5-methylcytosine-specific restriction endonuclease McrA